MSAKTAQLIPRLAPVVFIAVVAARWFSEIEGNGPWGVRNSLPLALLVLLSWLCLHLGDGRWSGKGWRMPLGVVGFAIPALGLSAYLHYAYAINLNGMFDAGAGDLFRFLPYYTVVAGAIGFAIGWIVGRNVL